MYVCMAMYRNGPGSHRVKYVQESYVLLVMCLRTGLACHGIFRKGFSAIFKSSKKQQNIDIGQLSMATLLGNLISDLALVSDASAPDDPVQSAFVAPDIAPSKVQGVRAKKSLSYVERSETPAEMYLAVLAVGPLEKYMYWLFKCQKEQSWLSPCPDKRPLVILTSQSSPVLEALCEYAAALSELPPLQMSDLFHLCGHLTFRCKLFQCQCSGFIIEFFVRLKDCIL